METFSHVCMCDPIRSPSDHTLNEYDLHVVGGGSDANGCATHRIGLPEASDW